MRLAARSAPPGAPAVRRCDELPEPRVFTQAYDVVITRIGRGIMAHTSFGARIPRNPTRGLVRRTLHGAFALVFGVALAVPGWTQGLVGRDRAPPDLMGEWTIHDDEDPGQPLLGQYLGMPFNDAGRMRADTSAESIWGTAAGVPAEYRCRPHSAPHSWRGVGGARILKGPRSSDTRCDGLPFPVLALPRPSGLPR